MKNLAYWKSQRDISLQDKFLRSRKFIEQFSHVDQMWEILQKNYGHVLAVRDLRGKTKIKFSYLELAGNIEKASKAFFSLGLKKGEVVTLISENSPRWLIVDQALMRIGAVDAVRGCNTPSVELDYIIEHSQSQGLIVQSKEVWEKLENRDDLKKKMKFIISLQDEIDGLISWNKFLDFAKNTDEASYQNQVKSRNINDIATILYTSGTTGKPKGVPLTHSNLLHQVINLACIADPKPGTTVLSVLPIWHSYERSAEYFFFSCACTQYYTSPKYLKDDIKIVRPVVMATVPRLWEAIHDGFYLALQKMPRNKRKIISLLLKNSSIYKKNWRNIKNLQIYKVSPAKKISSFFSVLKRFPLHKISALFLWPMLLKELCGDRLKFPINGGGALPEHVDLFFESLGINVLVGYGLTETSPVLTCRRTWSNVRGTSGQPLPSTEVKIVDEKGKLIRFHEIGKILVRGPQVMSGYLNNESATEKVLSQDGWFDTGDLGFLIPNGCLVITGRAKDTIVLLSGENIEPGPLETEILSSEFIEQIQLIGQDQKNLAALIVPNFEAFERHYPLMDINSMNKDGKIRKFFKSHVNTMLRKRQLARNEEQIIDCYFVEQFTIENGLLTQTLKQKRREIEGLYKNQINEIYKKQIKKEKLF
tara:strand:- start:314 stop:2257 length:1944 start_codon:yes stop_codon:yes gene_type:complete